MTVYRRYLDRSPNVPRIRTWPAAIGRPGVRGTFRASSELSDRLSPEAGRTGSITPGDEQQGEPKEAEETAQPVEQVPGEDGQGDEEEPDEEEPEEPGEHPPLEPGDPRPPLPPPPQRPGGAQTTLAGSQPSPPPRTQPPKGSGWKLRGKGRLPDAPELTKEGQKFLVWQVFDENNGDLEVTRPIVKERFNIDMDWPQLAVLKRDWFRYRQAQGLVKPPAKKGRKPGEQPAPETGQEEPSGADEYKNLLNNAMAMAYLPESVQLGLQAKQMLAMGNKDAAEHLLRLQALAAREEIEERKAKKAAKTAKPEGEMNELTKALTKATIDRLANPGADIDHITKLATAMNRSGFGAQDPDVAMAQCIAGPGGPIQYSVDRVCDTIREVGGAKPLKKKGPGQGTQGDEEDIPPKVQCSNCKAITWTKGQLPSHCSKCGAEFGGFERPDGTKIRAPGRDQPQLPAQTPNRAQQQQQQEPEDEQAPVRGPEDEEGEEEPEEEDDEASELPSCHSSGKAPVGYDADDEECQNCDLNASCRPVAEVAGGKGAPAGDAVRPLPAAAYDWWDKMHRLASFVSNDTPDGFLARMRSLYCFSVTRKQLLTKTADDGTETATEVPAKVIRQDLGNLKASLYFCEQDLGKLMELGRKIAAHPDLVKFCAEHYQTEDGKPEPPMDMIETLSNADHRKSLEAGCKQTLQMAAEDGLSLTQAEKDQMGAEFQRWVGELGLDGSQPQAAAPAPPPPQPPAQPAVRAKRTAPAKRPVAPRAMPQPAQPAAPAADPRFPVIPPEHADDLRECPVCRDVKRLPRAEYPAGYQVRLGVFRQHLYRVHPPLPPPTGVEQ